MSREQRRTERGPTELLARREKHVAERRAPLVHRAARTDLAREGIPVRVQAGRRNTDERVTFANALRSQDLLAIDDADEEPGEVVGVGGVHARHLRRLAAEERGAEPGARVGHRPYDASEDMWIDLRCREVVEEEERLGAHRKGVVDTVVDEVRADDLVTVEEACELELRADAVGGRNEVLRSAGRGAERAALAHVADDLGPPRARDPVLHAR